ncbi:MAG: acyltransferase family protein [Clostridia bacterium]|nr:acyltransferase family protein [Clostridia bacterium]
MKERLHFWDNYKGVLIFLVVLGHFLYSYALRMDGGLADLIVTFIYSFHMPAFVFCSGYLSKSERSRSMTYLTKLLIYYLIFNTITMLYDRFVDGGTIAFLTPYYSFWYILSLIAWRLGIKKLAKVKGIVPLSFIICLVLGFWGEFTNVLSIRRTICFFPFFLIGYLFDAERFNSFIKKRNWKTILLGALFVAIVTAATICFVVVKNVTITMLLYGTYSNVTDAIMRVILIAIAVCFIIGMMLVVPNVKVPILTNIGKNSLLIYLVHRIITLVYCKFLSAGSYNHWYLMFAFIASVLTCVVLGNNRLNMWFDSGVSHIAVEIGSNSKKGKITIGVMLIIFILLLCVNPLSIVL